MDGNEVRGDSTTRGGERHEGAEAAARGARSTHRAERRRHGRIRRQAREPVQRQEQSVRERQSREWASLIEARNPPNGPRLTWPVRSGPDRRRAAGHSRTSTPWTVPEPSSTTSFQLLAKPLAGGDRVVGAIEAEPASSARAPLRW